MEAAEQNEVLAIGTSAKRPGNDVMRVAAMSSVTTGEATVHIAALQHRPHGRRYHPLAPTEVADDLAVTSQPPRCLRRHRRPTLERADLARTRLVTHRRAGERLEIDVQHHLGPRGAAVDDLGERVGAPSA